MAQSAGDHFDIPYVAPLLGNIRQILTGLQGFDSMALEIIQNADDARATKIRFDVTDASLRIWNNASFTNAHGRLMGGLMADVRRVTFMPSAWSEVATNMEIRL